MDRLRIVLLGCGGVGRALLHQIVENRRYHRDRLGAVLPVVAVCDSSGTLLARDGLPDDSLSRIIRLKERGKRLSESPGGQPGSKLLDDLAPMSGEDLFVVDCTAADSVTPLLLESVEGGCPVVLANKKPLTADWKTYRRLAGIGTERRVRSRWEATVGSGVPVLAALRRLVGCGDRIESIQGVASGTLGRLMTGLQQGRRLSEIVREAHAQGATEPDPRDDLGGRDAARKALILARGMGLELEFESVAVESLYPEEMASLQVGEFLDALVDLDEEFSRRHQEAQARGRVLRYVLRVERSGCRVGLEAVPAHSPIGRLVGADNIFQFKTGLYDPEPLTLVGRGAGVSATAAGVLSDILELAGH